MSHIIPQDGVVVSDYPLFKAFCITHSATLIWHDDGDDLRVRATAGGQILIWGSHDSTAIDLFKIDFSAACEVK